MIELSYPGDLTDPDGLIPQLSTTGLSYEACQSKARLFGKAAAALSVTGADVHTQSLLAFFVPGRLEVLGKHTDYAGGRSLVAALEQGFCIVARPRDDRQITIIDARNGETLRFHADSEMSVQKAAWAKYPMTVVRRIARNFPGANRGADIAFVSDLPAAAGLGSSSALMTGVFLVLSEVNQLPARDEYWHDIGNKIDLANYLGTIENGQSFGNLAGDEKADDFGGSEDMIAIHCAEPNSISQYAFGPVEFEKMLPLPVDHVFAIGCSGVAVEQTAPAVEKRNAIVQMTVALAELWRRETGRDDPHLAAALGSSPDAAERLAHLLGTVETGTFDRGVLLARLEHFMIESGKLIPEAGDALRASDLRTFGRLVDRSQHTAERRLGNQTPETIFLAASARKHGAVAATSFGEGFGGSVWALVETAHADDLLMAWSDEYRAEFPQLATQSVFFLTGAGPAAFRVC